MFKEPQAVDKHTRNGTKELGGGTIAWLEDGTARLSQEAPKRKPTMFQLFTGNSSNPRSVKWNTIK